MTNNSSEDASVSLESKLRVTIRRRYMQITRVYENKRSSSFDGWNLKWKLQIAEDKKVDLHVLKDPVKLQTTR